MCRTSSPAPNGAGFAHRIRREIRAKRRHHFNRRISLVNYISPETKPEHMLVDESATNVVAELGQCLSSIEVEGRAFGASSFSLVMYDTDPHRLEKGVAECAKTFGRHDGVLHVESYNALNAWLAVLPGNTAHNLRRLTLLDTNHADLLPLAGVATGAVTSGDPLKGQECLAVFRSEQHTAYRWRLHYEDVGHTLILGATGSGKSFLLNFLVTHAQKYDPITVIFDLGGGFQKLTTLLGGSRWRIGLTNDGCRINPFGRRHPRISIFSRRSRRPPAETSSGRCRTTVICRPSSLPWTHQNASLTCPTCCRAASRTP